MTRQEFRKLCENGPVILDGATGTNLQKAGMPAGVCPEDWILNHKDIFLKLQRDFVKAGTQILYSPTFTANRIKLAEYGREEELAELNKKLTALSVEAAEGKAFIAGDMTMTGQQLYPMGELMFEELVDIYKEQAVALIDGGADLFVVETMMSLQETRAALIAIRETCDLPVMTSLTFNEDGRTLFGTDPVTAVVVLESLGADAVGMNCSTGPEGMTELVKKMSDYAGIPVLAKPNAGMPELDEDGNTIYRTSPEEFAVAGRKLVEAGAALVGGCCGTTPEHIKALAEAVKGMPVRPLEKKKRRLLSSERKTIEIDLDGPFQVIGERINPTGKKKLQEELRAGSLDLVRSMAREQEKKGAAILDVNMGLNGIDEKEMMKNVIYEVSSIVDCPLCIDSSHVDIIEAALRIYPGRALINSISLEKVKFEQLLPIAKKYGAMFILLPLSDEGLPKTLEEKHEIIRIIRKKALELGLSEEDIVVDGLVATVGANPDAALECLETIRYCKEELGLATVCGLSNISFGLPARQYVNSAFLTMAISKGLTMAIANPSQELLMNAAFASDLLLHKADSDIRYIHRMNELENREAPGGNGAGAVQRSDGNGPGATGAVGASESGNTPGTAGKSGRKTDGSGISAAGEEQKTEIELLGQQVFDAVLNGEKNTIVESVEKTLQSGAEPGDIINGYLIPAINEVGVLFEKQIYFLPQLISSANAMKMAVEYLEPMLKRDENEKPAATIIMATVEGDIHDIGKNLVVLMLKNYGYHVIDLGKDVKTELIVERAMEDDAAIIGLSALMTTTMMRMKDVVELAKEKGYTGKIIVGGAAITPSFADEIGADGYSSDAADCVKLVGRLLAD